MSDPVIRLNVALQGRYRVERELGEGGMATVYLADDLKHERKVALKVLKPELAAVVGGERFLAEIKTTAYRAGELTRGSHASYFPWIVCVISVRATSQPEARWPQRSPCPSPGRHCVPRCAGGGRTSRHQARRRKAF